MCNNSEDLLQNKVWLALPSTYPSAPHLQHRQALQGAGKQQLFMPCTASLLLLLHWDVTWQRKSPSSSRTRTESKFPMSHHSRGAISHNNHYPTFPFPLPLLPFLFSLCSVKIIVQKYFFFLKSLLKSTALNQHDHSCLVLYSLAPSKCSAFKAGVLQVALSLLQVTIPIK